MQTAPPSPVGCVPPAKAEVETEAEPKAETTKAAASVMRLKFLWIEDRHHGVLLGWDRLLGVHAGLVRLPEQRFMRGSNFLRVFS
ncbi:hypothetical protein JQK88_27280 [Mesorhizobium caraganae]|uniref:hypothetical protein n=1 Tax=Mesorhizobium caraganae TaxID=483206 RepID=UPI00193A5134|nr:hypothetical protein [Mesorhizobium caraganae]MBM2714863.1 hypothetical protein [Mesorhizobium caraganae]